jgi:hypothetical protein
MNRAEEPLKCCVQPPSVGGILRPAKSGGPGIFWPALKNIILAEPEKKTASIVLRAEFRIAPAETSVGLKIGLSEPGSIGSGSGMNGRPGFEVRGYASSTFMEERYDQCGG